MTSVQRGRTSVGRLVRCRGGAGRSPRRAGRTGASPRFLVALALLASTRCSHAPDPLEVERWVITSPRPTKRLFGQRDRCEVGSDTRPALGCPQLVAVDPVGEITTTPSGLA